jgi:hypothetical protein
MMHQLKGRLTYSNVMATVAVFVALGGTSYAAITLPKNSVGSAQIKSSAVGSSEVRNRSLGVTDLSRAARTSLKGQRGAKGDQGPPGIVQGPGNTQKVNVSYQTDSAGVAAEGTSQLTVQCPPEYKVISGGFRKDGGTDVSVRESYPSNNNTAWTAFVGDDDVAPAPAGRYTVFAICADVNG